MNSHQNQSTSEPLVSVITAAYNSELFIINTIRSVQSQTYTNWEMIIVDDVSTDETRDIVKNEMRKDNRIKLICLEANSGAAVARNTAIKAAEGRFIAFLDSDDLWLPNKLENQVSFMLENDYAFTFTQYRIMNEDGSVSNKVVEIPAKITYHELLKNTIIGCLTVMLDTQKLDDIEMPNIRSRQDFALWLKILRTGVTAYGLQEELAKYRIVEGSVSRNKVKAAKRNWYVYRHIEKLSLPYSVWCFINYAWTSYKKNR